MLKNVIAPIQAWLLSMNQCVGCGRKLGPGEKFICKCGRVFIYDAKTKKYRRALFSEI